VGVRHIADFKRMSEKGLFGKKPSRGEPESWVKGRSTLPIEARFDDQGSLVELTGDGPAQD